MHLRELERRHGPQLVEPPCSLLQRFSSPVVLRFYGFIGSANAMEDVARRQESRKRALREMDKYTKAIYRVLAVRDLTFRRGTDPGWFTARHKAGRS
jgi:hypothetical protein